MPTRIEANFPNINVSPPLRMPRNLAKPTDSASDIKFDQMSLFVASLPTGASSTRSVFTYGPPSKKSRAGTPKCSREHGPDGRVTNEQTELPGAKRRLQEQEASDGQRKKAALPRPLPRPLPRAGPRGQPPNGPQPSTASSVAPAVKKNSLTPSRGDSRKFQKTSPQSAAPAATGGGSTPKCCILILRPQMFKTLNQDSGPNSSSWGVSARWCAKLIM